MSFSSTTYAPISLTLHARIDAAVLTLVLVSPWLFGFTQHRGGDLPRFFGPRLT